MIVLAMAAAEAAVALPFAPPLDRTLRYRIVRTDPRPDGSEARIETIETLRFARGGANYVVTHETEQVEVTAVPRLRLALEALFVPLLHVPTGIAVSTSGIVGAPVDPARAWDAIRAASAALDARIAADKALPPALAAMERRSLADDLSPAQRDARLADGVTALLAPALPPLVADMPRAFTSAIAAGGGMLAAQGTITLGQPTAATLSLHIALASAPGAAAAAADRLRATIDPALPPELRGRIERAATELAGSVFAETSDYVIDARTGMILSRRIARDVTPANGARRPLGITKTERLP